MERYRGLLCQWSLRQDVAAMKKCASTTKKANSNLDRKRSMLLHPRGKIGNLTQNGPNGATHGGCSSPQDASPVTSNNPCQGAG